MQAVFDQAGTPIRLGPELGKGGEGSVYALATQTDCVAKLYHEPVESERASKIACMTGLLTERLLQVTAWPQSTLHQHAGGPVVGLVMRRLRDHKEAHLLYSPKSRRVEFPDATWRFLIHAASNVARAFATVHQHGHVIGDVNHGNVMVGPQATVTLIDCDSFQVHAPTQLFRCGVGVPTYTPPELQGQSFRRVDRTSNHDNFGLAVLLFHLLFMGRHPFAGRFTGTGDMPIEQAIKEGRFAFGSQAGARQMQPPPFTLTLSGASEAIAALFERAFHDGGAGLRARPTAQEWVNSLEALNHRLSRCSRNPSHEYFSSLHACPWCETERGTGSLLFYTRVRVNTALKSFDLAVAWKAIAAIDAPGPAFPPVREALASQILPSPGARAIGMRRRLLRGLSRAAQAAAVIVLFVPSLPMAVRLLLSGFLAVVRIALGARGATAAEQKQCLQDMQVAENEIVALQLTWSREAEEERYRQVLSDLAEARQQYELLPATREELLREAFLQSAQLQHADIPGIGAGRKAVLASYGVESAADVTPHNLSLVPGFGLALCGKLLDWREAVERRFELKRERWLSRSQLHAVDTEVARKKLAIEQLLLDGPAQLSRVQQNVLAARDCLRPQLEDQLRRYLQAEADLGVLQ